MAIWINLCLLSVVGILMFNEVSPYPNGADEEACQDMRPRHYRHSPSKDPAPFTISVSSETFHYGMPVTVTIRKETGHYKPIMGFLLRSRRADQREEDNNAIGRFETISGTKLMCGTSGLTHSDRGSWSEIAVQWTLGTEQRVAVQFRVTVVLDTDTFWVDERSPIVYHHQLSPPPSLPSPTPRAYELDITEGCGDTKGCYRNPAGCSEEMCDIVVTWKKLNDYSFEFAMSADTDGWVAVGFSEDKFMGDDQVMECVLREDGKSVDVRLSMNEGKENKLAQRSALGSLSDIDWTRNMGRLRCHFVRSASFLAAAGKKAPAKATPYHLFMAKGPAENGVKLRHSLEPNKYPYVSPSQVSISDNEDVSGTARYPLVKVHGCLMLIAWMMCASTALLLAKYYKRMWPNETLCGVEVWFAVHRALMIVCLILTAIAFILIFIHVGGYSHLPDYPEKAHPPLGICVMILVILNPFITLFRCKPQSKYRPIFNWFHWLFGTVAYVLQLPAIFIGLNLHKSFVPSWATWIMTAFILFHLIIELLLEIHGCLNARKQKRRDDDFERTKKTDFKGEYQGLKEEPVGHRFKKIVLSIYLVVVIILGVIMVIAVAAG